MPGLTDEAMDIVLHYHERTKHRPNQYARSLGYLDWPNQPDPFRRYAGTEKIDLTYPVPRQEPTYDSLFTQNPPPSPLDSSLISRLFSHSLALSAWKQVPGSRPWSLRVNPSSGALYPTEGYLVSGDIPGMIQSPGVFHYAPYSHQLERRGSFTSQAWALLTGGYPQPCLLLGLSTIYWRESWKYGERAFRYCHLDIGHAIGAIAFAARAVSWDLRHLNDVPSDILAKLLGVHLQSGMEAEHADALLLLYPGKTPSPILPTFTADEWQERLPGIVFQGEPNRLSRNHHPWAVIEQVVEATEFFTVQTGGAFLSDPPNQKQLYQFQDRDIPAEQIIRQRRSAAQMDRTSYLNRESFYQLLSRLLPSSFPFQPLPWHQQISLVFFVHRVDDLSPGIYLLIRDQAHEQILRGSLKTGFVWKTPQNCPPELPFYCLEEGDVRRVSRNLSCHQDIASDGIFCVTMIAPFESSLENQGPWFYPRLYWEAGLIGQVLYLEAEAAGIRGTGIGCFFDDLLHQALGIENLDWQDLYHFTVGRPVHDSRLDTIPPYDHLGDRKT